MINSEVRKAGPFDGTGAAAVHPFTFKVFQAGDLYVVQRDADGVETEVTTGLTIALNDDQDIAPGGTVTATTPVGSTITITSDVPATQPMQLTNSGGFFPRVLNDSADRLTIIIQQIKERLGRTLSAPLSSVEPLDGLVLPTAAERAGKFLAFDGAGAIAPASGTGADGSLREDLADPLLGGGLVATKNNAGVTRTAKQYLNDLEDAIDDVWSASDALFLRASRNGVAGQIVSPGGDDTAELQAFFDTCAAMGVVGLLDVPCAISAHVTASANLKVASCVPAAYKTITWIGSAAVSDDYMVDVLGDNVSFYAYLPGDSFRVRSTPGGVTGQDKRRWGFRVRGRKINFTAQDIDCVDVNRLYATSSADAVWANVDLDLNCPVNPRCIRGSVVFLGAQVPGSTAGADFMGYVNGGRIRDTYYENVAHGVQWWGGNAATAGVGDLGLERKCVDLVVERCRAKSVGGAFVWGSLGTRINVLNCTGVGAGDVGFDAEGCTNTLFLGCHAHNASNGGLATFFKCDGVSFLVCKSTSDDDTIARLTAINNSTLSLENRNITVDACVFEAIGYIADFGGIGAGVNATRGLNVLSCSFKNCTMSLVGSSSFDQRVIGCNFVWDVAASGTRPVFVTIGAFNNVGLLGARVVFKANTLRSYVAQPSESVGLLLAAMGSNVGCAITCKTNEIDGFDIPAAAFAQGSSASISQHIQVSDNTFDVALLGRIRSDFTVNFGTDVITAPSFLRMETGTQVRLTNSGGALPAPLAGGTDYWWIRLSQTTGKLATSLDNANGGTAIDIADAGTGTHTMHQGRTTTSTLTLSGNVDINGNSIT